jgi:peptidoglycan/xylan/chitin deacetylase (PgdA/CDA1 family)
MLPVLLYHSVAPSRSQELSAYHVTPEQFEEQLCFLRDNGFHSVSLGDCHNWYYESTPLPAGSIMITFDDGYRDFLEYAWPLLQQYGFSAHIFLVAGELGQTNRWDQCYGESKPLLTWDEIYRLQEEGVSFGSHSLTHPTLTTILRKQVKKELYDSRLLLQQGFGTPVTSFAYPYGEFNRRIQFLTGYHGYNLAFTCEPGLCTERISPLALPRIEIEREDTLKTFADKIGVQRRISGRNVMSPYLQVDFQE